MKRIHWGTLAVTVAVVGLGVALLAQSKSKTVALPSTAVIGNEYASAGGCSDAGHEAQIGIPNSQFLDTTVQDPVWHIQGITFRETNKVGNSGIRNAKLYGFLTGVTRLPGLNLNQQNMITNSRYCLSHNSELTAKNLRHHLES